jgi:hypothetical protein
MNRTLAALAITALLLAPALAQDAQKPESYLPLAEGNSWTYNVITKNGEKEEVQTVTLKSVKDGDGWALESANDTALFQKEHLQADEKGVRSTKFTVQENEVKPSEPLIRLKFPVKKDDTWAQSVTLSDRKVDVKGKVLGEEKVKVAAGEFTAMKVEVALTADFEGLKVSFTTTTWYAPKVGMVKTVVTITLDGNAQPPITSELAKYTVKDGK